MFALLFMASEPLSIITGPASPSHSCQDIAGSLEAPSHMELASNTGSGSGSGDESTVGPESFLEEDKEFAPKMGMPPLKRSVSEEEMDSVLERSASLREEDTRSEAGSCVSLLSSHLESISQVNRQAELEAWRFNEFMAQTQNHIYESERNFCQLIDKANQESLTVIENTINCVHVPSKATKEKITDFALYHQACLSISLRTLVAEFRKRGHEPKILIETREKINRSIMACLEESKQEILTSFRKASEGDAKNIESLICHFFKAMDIMTDDALPSDLHSQAGVERVMIFGKRLAYHRFLEDFMDARKEHSLFFVGAAKTNSLLQLFLCSDALSTPEARFSFMEYCDLWLHKAN